MSEAKSEKSERKKLLLFSTAIVLSIVILIVVLMQTAGVGAGLPQEPGVTTEPSDTTTTPEEGLGDASSTEKPRTEIEHTFLQSDVRGGTLLYVDETTSLNIGVSVVADLYTMRHDEDGTPLYHIRGSSQKLLDKAAATAFVALARAYKNTPNAMRLEVFQSADFNVTNDYRTALAIGVGVLDELLISEGLAAPRLANSTAWLFENMHKYGFVYVAETEQTGHLRYVGVPHATYMYTQNKTLREYLTIVQSHTYQMPLELTHEDTTYCVYYIPAGSAESFQGLVPTTPYTASGDNLGGIIIAYEK